MAEDIDAHLSGGFVVALPILFRWIRFAKIHCAKRVHRIRKTTILASTHRASTKAAMRLTTQTNAVFVMVRDVYHQKVQDGGQ